MRELGFYFIKSKSRWIVAEWKYSRIKEHNWWFYSGTGYPIHPNKIQDVLETQILPPTE